MSEVELKIDVFMSAFMAIPDGSPVTVDLGKVKEIVAHCYQLRQKLEPAEAQVKHEQFQLKKAQECLLHERNRLDSATARADKAESIIREAREHIAVLIDIAQLGFSEIQEPEHDEIFNQIKSAETFLQAAPVPAMPIQDDNWVTITNEEWNIPKLGQRVIVCIDGVVQNVPVKLDCTDPDIGLSKYYWDHKDFDESPFVKAGDSWMPWPTKPQSEVKPSC